jgi:lipid-binding SYLF domain-containing protein
MTARIAALLLAFFSVTAALAAPSKEEQRQDVRAVAQNTLERLYKAQPGAKDAIDRSAGYAVFSNFGMKILFAGGGRGQGIAFNRKAKTETFMRMVEVQAGLGIGVKKFRLVWVFEKQADLDRFINTGFEVGGQATATAQVGGKGQDVYAGALSISPGVWLYQLTDEGIAAELTAKGTKYYKDSDLN